MKILWQSDKDKISFKAIEHRYCLQKTISKHLKTNGIKFSVVSDCCNCGRRLGNVSKLHPEAGSWFAISSRYLQVLLFILSGERNNCEEEIIITFERNQEEIFIISGLPRAWTGLRHPSGQMTLSIEGFADCATAKQGNLRQKNSHKGRYTRGVLLPENAPGSFCTHEGAFSSSLNLPRELAPKYLTG